MSAYNEKPKQQRRGSVSKKDNRKTCCYYFSIKSGFVMFGICDIMILLGLTVVCVNDYMHDKSHPSLSQWILFVIMFQKVLLFLIELCSDSLRTKHIYRVMLRINMLLWMFAAPVYYLYKIKNEMIPVCCDATAGHFF